MNRIHIPLPAAILLLFVALALPLMAAVLAHADADSSPPEWPTQTPPAVTSEPYPPPGGYPGPEAYPAPGSYLPVVVEMEAYP